MSLWDILPDEIQDKILLTAVKLIYDGTVKHFQLVVHSLDARLAAHYSVPKHTEPQYRSVTTVYASTYTREHIPNRFSDPRGESYNELQITLPGDSFGCKHIDRVYDMRG